MADLSGPEVDYACLASPGVLRRDLPWLIAGTALALMAVGVTHWRALESRAICFDDSQYILANPLVRSPSWNSVGRFFSEVLQPSTVKGYYQPLTMVSLMMDAALANGPGDLSSFRRTNFVLHLLNVCLIAAFMYLLFGRPIPAVLVGLLFGVHPLTVESVAWMSERKTLLATFFALGSLCLYVWFARSRDRRWLIAAGAAYVLAMLSKPTAVPLCLIFLLLDWWPLNRQSKQTVIEKLPFIALAAVFSIITIVSQGRTAGVGFQGEHVIITTFLLVCHNLMFYLTKWVWPSGLTPSYPVPEPFSLSNPMLLWGLMGTLALIPLLILSLQKTRALAVGLLFYALALLPAIQVLGFSFVVSSDKFAYLPLVGMWMIVCWAIGLAWDRRPAAGTAAPLRTGLIVAAVFLAFCESAVAREYLLAWKDSKTLHEHMLAHNENSAMVMDLLAMDLIMEGKLDEATALETKAVAADPQYSIAHFNLANSLLRLNRIDEAVNHYQEALRLNPNYGMAYSMLGRAFALQGKMDEAVEQSRKGVQADPNIAELHYNLATLLAQRGKAEEAAQEFVQAIFLRPNYPEAHNNLGSLLASFGNFQKAAENFEQAIRLSPNYLQAHANLARAYDRLARRAEALREYQEVLRLNPKDEPARRAVYAINRMMGMSEAELRGDTQPQPPQSNPP